jgi:hypothetical protein
VIGRIISFKEQLCRQYVIFIASVLNLKSNKNIQFRSSFRITIAFVFVLQVGCFEIRIA